MPGPFPYVIKHKKNDQACNKKEFTAGFMPFATFIFAAFDYSAIREWTTSGEQGGYVALYTLASVGCFAGTIWACQQLANNREQHAGQTPDNKAVEKKLLPKEDDDIENGISGTNPFAINN